MKNLLSVILILFLATACTDEAPVSETPGDNNDTKEVVKIGSRLLSVRTNIFETIEFGITASKSFDWGWGLGQVYDSIVWEIPALNSSFKVFSHSPNHAQLTSMWVHTFFLPGEYDAMMHSYKDNRIAHGDTARITVLDKRDFLGYNWMDIAQSVRGGEGYADQFSKVWFSTSHDVTDGTAWANFIVSPDDDYNYYEKQKELLLNMTTAIYGPPDHSTDGDRAVLEDMYQNLFSNKKDRYYPVYIWITPVTKIVLLENSSCWGIYGYEIYAEPNR